MIRYVFTDQPMTFKGANKAEPQKIGEALSALSSAAGGALHPHAVVDAARDEGSPLHPHFEWDDTVAADRYRLDQAREIIRCVRVEEDGPEPVRAYLSIAGADGVSYRTVQDVRLSVDLQTSVLAAAERDLTAFERRYRELSEVCELVRSAKSAVKKRREKIETQVAA